MTIMSKRVLLAGTSALYHEWKELLIQQDYHVLSLDQVDGDKDPIDFVVEVTNYDLIEKKTTIQKIDQLLIERELQVPILTTSLAITATEVASWTNMPQRVCGFGTLIPLNERKLIELAPALQTDEAILGQAQNFIQSLGKETAVVDDEVGLVFPRILALIINEAVFALMEGIATKEDIDVAMKKGTNYPYGPLEWADQIGLDEVYAIIRGLYQNLGEDRFRPASLLRKMVLAGQIGKRSHQGFYSYHKQAREW